MKKIYNQGKNVPFLRSSFNEKNSTCSDWMDASLMNTLPPAMIAWSKNKNAPVFRPRNISLFSIFALPLPRLFLKRDQAHFLKIRISWNNSISPNNLFYCTHATNKQNQIKPQQPKTNKQTKPSLLLSWKFSSFYPEAKCLKTNQKYSGWKIKIVLLDFSWYKRWKFLVERRWFSSKELISWNLLIGFTGAKWRSLACKT